MADMRAHVQAAHVFAIRDDLAVHAEPPQHGARQRHAGVFVAAGMPFAVLAPRGGDGLAQIVGQRREDKRLRPQRPRFFLRGGMQHPHAVRVCVALRVIARRLGHADERRQLAKPCLSASAGGARQKTRPARRSPWPFFIFAQHARGESASVLIVPHLFKRLCIRRQAKPRRKLRAPQHAERVFGEAVPRHGAQHTPAQIGLPAEGIDDFPGQRIPQNRVDGKIPPRRRARKGERRIEPHVKIAVLRPGSPLQPRHGQINPRAFEGKNAVSRAAFVHFAKFRGQTAQRLRRKAVYLAVDIRALAPRQRVAHTAADQHGAAAERLCPQRDSPNRFLLNFLRHTVLSVALGQRAGRPVIPARPDRPARRRR